MIIDSIKIEYYVGDFEKKLYVTNRRVETFDKSKIITTMSYNVHTKRHAIKAILDMLGITTPNVLFSI